MQLPILQVPFVPSTFETIKTMLKLANIQPGQKVADLGSGDGRVLIAFAQAGAEAHGYETDKDLLIKCQDKILAYHLDDKVFLHWQNYWEENLSRFDIITIYGRVSIMDNLEKKLKKELKPGAKVISNVFTFPTWNYITKRNNVYIYIK